MGRTGKGAAKVCCDVPQAIRCPGQAGGTVCQSPPAELTDMERGAAAARDGRAGVDKGHGQVSVTKKLRIFSSPSSREWAELSGKTRTAAGESKPDGCQAECSARGRKGSGK